MKHDSKSKSTISHTTYDEVRTTPSPGFRRTRTKLAPRGASKLATRALSYLARKLKGRREGRGEGDLEPLVGGGEEVFIIGGEGVVIGKERRKGGSERGGEKPSPPIQIPSAQTKYRKVQPITTTTTTSKTPRPNTPRILWNEPSLTLQKLKLTSPRSTTKPPPHPSPYPHPPLKFPSPTPPSTKPRSSSRRQKRLSDRLLSSLSASRKEREGRGVGSYIPKIDLRRAIREGRLERVVPPPGDLEGGGGGGGGLRRAPPPREKVRGVIPFVDPFCGGGGVGVGVGERDENRERERERMFSYQRRKSFNEKKSLPVSPPPPSLPPKSPPGEFPPTSRSQGFLIPDISHKRKPATTPQTQNQTQTQSQAQTQNETQTQTQKPQPKPAKLPSAPQENPAAAPPSAFNKLSNIIEDTAEVLNVWGKGDDDRGSVDSFYCVGEEARRERQSVVEIAPTPPLKDARYLPRGEEEGRLDGEWVDDEVRSPWDGEGGVGGLEVGRFARWSDAFANDVWEEYDSLCIEEEGNEDRIPLVKERRGGENEDAKQDSSYDGVRVQRRSERFEMVLEALRKGYR